MQAKFLCVGALVCALLALLVAAPVVAGEVAASAEEAKPLTVGVRAPAPELRDVDGNPAPLDAIVGKGPVALVFYRGGW